MITIKARMLRKNGKVYNSKGTRCPICYYKLDAAKDRKYITSLFQSGKKERGYMFTIGFVCPDCLVHTVVQMHTHNSNEELIETLRIYRNDD